MALVLSDRIKETTTTTGTGTYTLAGAETGFESFSSIGDGNTTYYCCTDGVDFEVGIGTYTATGTTLARTTILQSSNSDDAVNWTSGTRFIFVTQPAEKAVFLNASDNIDLADNEKLILGSDSDFQVYHNGTNGYLQESTNAIIYRSAIHSFRNSADTEQLARFDQNGDVELYYDNSKKLNTGSTGVTVTGTLSATSGIAIDNTSGYGNIEIGGTSGAYIDLKSPTSDDYDIRLITTGTGGQFLSQDALRLGSTGTTSITNVSGTSTYANFIPAGAVELFYSGNKKLETTSTGATVTGTLVADGVDVGDSERIRLGADQDLQIYHDGSNSYIDNTTGHTYIRDNGFGSITLQPTSGENSGVFNANGSVELYYDNSKKFETTDTGVQITSFDPSANEEPTLDLYRNSASPADGDVLGNIDFSGEDSAGNKTVYAKINSDIIDQTDGTEDGRIEIFVMSAGAQQNRAVFQGNSTTRFVNRDVALAQNIDLIFEGATDDDNETTLTVVDPTADRTITLPDASGTVLLADGDGSSLTNVNATTLDSVDSTSFLRSDADDNKTFGNLTFEDNIKARFGTSGDLQIYHDGSHSRIAEVGQGNLKIQASTFQVINAADTEYIMQGFQDGAVELYHNNIKRIETTSTGAYITGNLTVNTDTTLGAATHRNWNDGDTDIDGLIGGSTFGNIIEGQNSGHFVLGIRENDISDGLRIISGGGNYNTDSTYDTVIASFMCEGNVGIGTTTPSQKLEVNGTIKIPTGGETGTRLQVGDDIAIFDDGNAHIHSLAGNLWINAADGSSDVRINNQENGNVILTNGTGNVGIGTTSPSDTLTVNGSFSATTKSFDIEHPTKEGYRLRYGSLEGAENGVYYRGQTDLDYIELPEHWIGLVDEKSITVQLTPKGKFQQLFVRDIEDLTVLVDGVEGDYYFVVFAERKDVDKLVVEYEG